MLRQHLVRQRYSKASQSFLCRSPTLLNLATPSLYGVCYTTPALNNTLTVQIHCITCHCHVASLLDRCCNLQGSQTCQFQAMLCPNISGQFQSVTGLSLITTPRCHYREVLCHSSACRISAFTKPISALAFRFITRPSAVLYVALPLQCKLFLAFPSLRNSDPFRHTAQLYSANAHQFISKANHVKSQPVQIISAHCLCRSQLCDTLTCLSISIAYPVLAIPQRFFAVQILCTTSHHWSLPLRFCA